ncbi:MAG: bifunctional 5,10-methylenetetrahydrofolate dehydrogenase/5,10-methenyltetrahydrofolate cyclohydrolase [Bacilli bacterium]|nr:bifunctional 5,10-methylenetetrahydrofolate dehydrogenase/5,10-methenyltetrahydrofolate cyclohydrolase [Bacilli bacterium]
MGKLIDGKELSSKIKEEIKNEVKGFMIKPCLAVIQIGDDEASNVYVGAKEKACNEVGIYFKHLKYDVNVLEKEIINKIIELNNDEYVNGILLQLPIPSNLNEQRIINHITSGKDVDGLNDINVGRLNNNKEGMIPCTAAGIIRLLEEYEVPMEGKNVVIVGRSKLVGKPLISLFLKKDATVTVCHSKTENLSDITKTADILVVATGSKWLIGKNDIKEDAVVIDVGVSRVDGKIYGDVNTDEVKKVASLITPSVGGVGPMTVAMLLSNVIKSYHKMNKTTN